MARRRKPKICKYGFWDALHGCPKKPCKFGTRYPNAYSGRCVETPLEKSRRLAAARLARAERIRLAKESRDRELARQLFGAGANGANGAGLMKFT